GQIMRWEDGRRSDNLEDERDAETSGGSRFGGGGRIGIGGIIIVLAVSFLTGQNPLQLLGMIQGANPDTPQQTQPAAHTAESEQQKDFVSVVLASTEDTWGTLLPQYGRQYEQPKLVLFTGAVQSACGSAQSAMGPFYCPGDHKVYLDLDFFRELEGKLGAGGDFARAYVIGHEIGHHVQNLLGTSAKVSAAEQRSSKTNANKLSVLLELQADCYAGVWAHHANQQRAMLESGDIEEAINAAAAVGDDRLQQSAGQAVSPESFTHGSSQARMHWFQIGIEQGDLNACNTFKS
ncbi:MAG: neutral zinc metallopeptidase, partial [Methylophilaceae bacterium]